jgi:hypothetical protein
MEMELLKLQQVDPWGPAALATLSEQTLTTTASSISLSDMVRVEF